MTVKKNQMVLHYFFLLQPFESDQFLGCYREKKIQFHNQFIHTFNKDEVDRSE